ncbi:hypothetical protein D7B24_004184 [Verticillium nonalfalfae]|uniref:Uncharacterized protein n=1 Tax=Verticillium nonalfalfae TaxID=1051616 RepID=A0A3M9YEC4_9PEZI|nr:uncharacterized protein D7B24_004184 [Verticillium nonalfalfae]RNJ58819.1 hypothetical protein D7B24_004184 [Verticillium nonalfalfae]
MPTSIAQSKPIEVVNPNIIPFANPTSVSDTSHSLTSASVDDKTSPAQKSVAVIGAGVSGVLAAAHLLRRNQRVTVFERSSSAGGIWRYIEDRPEDPEYPVTLAAESSSEVFPDRLSSRTTTLRTEKGLTRKTFAPPGPCYAGLRSNIPTYLMRSSLSAWPESAGRDVVPHHLVNNYIQGLAQDFGVNAVTEFNTRVEEVIKPEGQSQWKVRTLRIDNKCTKDTEPTFFEEQHLFDAVVIASGHYDIPFIPKIPGLSTLKKQFPERVTHSKQYRHPETFAGQNVVVVGGRVSAVDICRELAGISAKTYQSVRESTETFNFNILGDQTKQISEIDHIALKNQVSADETFLEQNNVLPVQLHLKDGRVLDGIHAIIFATGYQLTYPYLRSFEVPPDQVTRTSLVESTKSTVHNLYKDIFYIPDPTLTFVGTPFDIVTFACFDYQAQAIAQVLSGAAALPNHDTMRAEYETRLTAKTASRQFHSLRGHEIEYVQGLVDWLNSEADRLGVKGQHIEGYSKEWIEGYWILQKRVSAALGLQDPAQLET